jgi:pimeloyl-ACP methyl ester carboxylesterase
MHTTAPIPCTAAQSLSLDFRLTAIYAERSETEPFSVQIFRRLNLTCRVFQSAVEGERAYTFTLLDVDGSVQYGSAIPPRLPCAVPEAEQTACPILFSTHGSGVDASSPSWTNTYHAQARAWSIFPTNRGAHGFAWEGPGRLNALATLAQFVQETPGVPPDEATKIAYRADPDRVLFSGHSMGGHGCMVLATNYPDRALAAACLAGWIKVADIYIVDC